MRELKDFWKGTAGHSVFAADLSSFEKFPPLKRSINVARNLPEKTEKKLEYLSRSTLR